jgi:hypothetical protein
MAAICAFPPPADPADLTDAVAFALWFEVANTFRRPINTGRP